MNELQTKPIGIRLGIIWASLCPAVDFCWLMMKMKYNNMRENMLHTMAGVVKIAPSGHYKSLFGY